MSNDVWLTFEKAYKEWACDEDEDFTGADEIVIEKSCETDGEITYKVTVKKTGEDGSDKTYKGTVKAKTEEAKDSAFGNFKAKGIKKITEMSDEDIAELSGKFVDALKKTGEYREMRSLSQILLADATITTIYDDFDLEVNGDEANFFEILAAEMAYVMFKFDELKHPLTELLDGFFTLHDVKLNTLYESFFKALKAKETVDALLSIKDIDVEKLSTLCVDFVDALAEKLFKRPKDE